MAATEGIDLTSLITERIKQDAFTLEEVQEQMADLILVREIIESIQAARKHGFSGGVTRVTPTSWAEFVELPLSTEDSAQRTIEESKERLSMALGRIGAAFSIPEVTMRVMHSHAADKLAIDVKLF